MEEELMAALTLSTNNNGGPKNGILPGERYQCFAFPDAIMYYIAMNPSNAQVYKKLIQTCKYFFNKNPMLVVRSLRNGDNITDSAYEWKVLLKESSNNSKTQKETNGYLYNATNVKIDMDKLPCKLWVTQYISIDELTFVWTKIGTPIISKIYRCDADIVYLNLPVLTFDELLFLASNASECYFTWHKITKNDGKGEVAFEKVIEKLTKLRKISWGSYRCECFSADTVKELLKLQHFANISNFTIEFITHELFDAKALFDYVKTRNKNMKVHLTYIIDNEGSAKFKKQIEEIVDEIIGTEVFTYMPPVIYDENFIDYVKQKKMEEISDRYANTRF